MSVDTTTTVYRAKLAEFTQMCTNPSVLLADIIANNRYLPRDYELPLRLRQAVADGSLFARFTAMPDFKDNVDSGTAHRLLRYFPSEAHVIWENPVIAAAFVHANGSSFDVFPILGVGDVRKTTPDFVDGTGVALDVKVTTVDQHTRVFVNKFGVTMYEPSFTINLRAANALYRQHACIGSAQQQTPVVFLGVCDNSTERVYFINIDKLVSRLSNRPDVVMFSPDGNSAVVNFTAIVREHSVCLTPIDFARFIAMRHSSLGDDRLEQLLAFTEGGYVKIVGHNFLFRLPQVTNGAMFKGFREWNYSITAGALYVNQETYEKMYDLGELLLDLNASRDEIRERVASWFTRRGVPLSIGQEYAVRLFVDGFTASYGDIDDEDRHSHGPSFIDMQRLVGFRNVSESRPNIFKYRDPATGWFVDGAPTTIAAGRGGCRNNMRLISMDVVHELPTVNRRELSWA